MAAFDEEVKKVLYTTMAGIRSRPGWDLSDPYTRLIVSRMNLLSLCEFILEADANENIELDLKRVVLGLMGTADFMEEGLTAV